jgi:hypothetical protein
LKLTTLAAAAAGYVLGSRAGHERYEQIVRLARRVAGSQTVQSTAGLLQAQLDELATHARHLIAAKLGTAHPDEPAGVNGYRH